MISKDHNYHFFLAVLSLTISIVVARGSQCPKPCQCNSALTEANCSNQQLGYIPHDLPTFLTKLNLHGNPLTQLNASALQHLQNLQHLDISHCQLISIEKEAFAGIPLKELTLHDNQLNDSVLFALLDLVALSHLNLARNNITLDLFIRKETDNSATPIVFPQSPLFSLNETNILIDTPRRHSPKHVLDANPGTDHSSNEMVTMNEVVITFNWPNLTHLDLRYNLIHTFPNISLPTLTKLFLCYNNLRHLTDNMISNLAALQTLEVSNNLLESLWSEDVQFTELNHLDVSHNNLTDFSLSWLDTTPKLKSLDLSFNNIQYLQPILHASSVNKLSLNIGSVAHSLSHLNMRGNDIKVLEDGTFSDYTNITSLDISYNTRLWWIETDALQGLQDLLTLNFSHCSELKTVPDISLSHTPNLLQLDLSYTGVHSITPKFLNHQSKTTINLQGTQWMCDCHAHVIQNYLKTSKYIDTTSIICGHPSSLKGSYLVNVHSSQLVCEGATVGNASQDVVFAIGAHALLDCMADGKPHPSVTWTLPTRKVLDYSPLSGSRGRLSPSHYKYHSSHVWHKDDIYLEEDASGRVHVLGNGSLYIDYVRRCDAGTYHCRAWNSHGSENATVSFLLDYSVIRVTMVTSLVVGFSTAFAFLALLTASSAVYRCYSSRKENRSKIMETLGTYRDNKLIQFTAYKTTKLDRLSAYKSAKFDQLSAFKTDKVDRLAAFTNASLHQLKRTKGGLSPAWSYVLAMREHYSNSVTKLRENCATNAEKLRDHYETNMSKIKDYHYNQVDRIRDGYNIRLVRIRDYGAQQMEKLRAQYNMHQMHLIKLLEALDISNCVTQIEAECQRTESLIFDADFCLNFDMQPVHVRDEADHEPGSQQISDTDIPDIPEPDLPDIVSPDIPMLPNIYTLPMLLKTIDTSEAGIDPNNFPNSTHYMSQKLDSQKNQTQRPCGKHKRRRKKAQHKKPCSEEEDAQIEGLRETQECKKHSHTRSKRHKKLQRPTTVMTNGDDNKGTYTHNCLNAMPTTSPNLEPDSDADISDCDSTMPSSNVNGRDSHHRTRNIEPIQPEPDHDMLPNGVSRCDNGDDSSNNHLPNISTQGTKLACDDGLPSPNNCSVQLSNGESID